MWHCEEIQMRLLCMQLICVPHWSSLSAKEMTEKYPKWRGRRIERIERILELRELN